MITKMKPLTAAQVKLLALAADGWEVAHAVAQQGGIGKGGKTQTINPGTMVNLLERGYLVKSGNLGFIGSKYTISPAGRKAYTALLSAQK